MVSVRDLHQQLAGRGKGRCVVQAARESCRRVAVARADEQEHRGTDGGHEPETRVGAERWRDADAHERRGIPGDLVGDICVRGRSRTLEDHGRDRARRRDVRGDKAAHRMTVDDETCRLEPGNRPHVVEHAEAVVEQRIGRRGDRVTCPVPAIVDEHHVAPEGREAAGRSEAGAGDGGDVAAEIDDGLSRARLCEQAPAEVRAVQRHDLDGRE